MLNHMAGIQLTHVVSRDTEARLRAPFSNAPQVGQSVRARRIMSTMPLPPAATLLLSATTPKYVRYSAPDCTPMMWPIRPCTK